MNVMVAGVIALCLAPGLAWADAERCAEAPKLLSVEGVTLSAARSLAKGDEESPVNHCVLSGETAERTGADGKPYAIHFELRLPDQWTGRLLHQFNGGNDGKVVPALGVVSGLTPDQSALARGMAVVSSDAGHDGDANPEFGLAGGAAFGFDFEARRDYGYDAVATLQPIAVALTEQYYGAPVTYRYGMGHSNGGRHAMVAASRMGKAFDGLVAGFPGFNLPRAALQHAWDVQSFLSVGADLPSSFSREDMAVVSRKVAAACDGLDGLEDGLVFDSAACQATFDPARLACAEGETADCLPAEKVAALVRVLGGPRDSQGHALYRSWLWDTGVSSGNWRFWKLESPIDAWAHQPLIAVMGSASLAQVFTTPPTRVEGTPDALREYLLNFDFDTDAPKISASTADFPQSAVEVMTPPDMAEPRLTEFSAHGGKLILFHGLSDPVFSFLDTASWYDRLMEGTEGAAAEFTRLYAVPGMPHGQGGASPDQFDTLGALIAWVENGEAPQAIIATVRADNKEAPEALRGQRRPLCPYPAAARYTGGAVELASSFVCD